MKLSVIFLSGIAAVAALSSAVTASAASAGTGAVSDTRLSAASNGVNVKYRSQSDIRAYLAAHPYSTSGSPEYAKNPDLTAPYTDAGALGSSALQNGLNALNSMRYIAGLPEVTLSAEYTKQCQQGSYINALNDKIDHQPARPAGVSDSIYQAGYDACGSSNLAMGYKNLAHSVIGYLNDSDASNIDRLGHRRWCLNPAMKKTGFGQVERCESMYAFDNVFAETEYTGVIWPAQNMPAELFDENQAWSWSLGNSIPNRGGVKVTLTRKSDGKVWRFSDTSANGFFNVENSNYGQPGCVIFRPSNLGGINAGDVFTVSIDGVGTPVNYTVSFFSLEDNVKPTAVTGFTATPSTNSVKLSWNKNSAADKYQIDVYKNGAWNYLTTTTGTSYTATGLSANTSYQFRIFAFKGSNYSSSASVTAKTGAASSGKPTAVTGFSASPSANSVKLTWNKNSTADKYQIDVYKNGAWNYLTTTTGTSYTATGLSANTSYQFRIFAFKGSNYSSSASVTAKTGAASSGKPTAVTGFSASPSTNSVKLSWNKNSAADSYQIDIYKNGKWTYLTKTTATSYTATGLSEGTEYFFRIFAFKGSSYSSSVRITSSTKPAAVTKLTAAPANKSIRLSWGASASADSYQVDVYKNGRWTYLTNTTGTYYNVTGLNSGYIYNFRVFAFKGSSYSSSSSISAIAL